MTVTDRINAENEAKYGKIKECCDMYPQFCRCSLPNTLHVKGVNAESSYAMKIENSKGYLVWGVNTLTKESKDIMAINLKPLIEQAKHEKQKYPYHLASAEGKAYSEYLIDDKNLVQGITYTQHVAEKIPSGYTANEIEKIEAAFEKRESKKDIIQDQGLNLSQEFMDSIGADFRRKINKKTFLQRLIFWK